MFLPVRRAFLFYFQEIGGIHGCILTADAEMDVSAHYGFHQCGIPGIADGLPHGDGVLRTDPFGDWNSGWYSRRRGG